MALVSVQQCPRCGVSRVFSYSGSETAWRCAGCEWLLSVPPASVVMPGTYAPGGPPPVVPASGSVQARQPGSTWTGPEQGAF
jgi:hypothetical protein